MINNGSAHTGLLVMVELCGVVVSVSAVDDCSPPTRRTQAERRAATRQKLLQATMTCLARDGYAATTIGRIVKEASVSHGASGHLFDSKTALLLATADHALQQIYKRWGDALLILDQAEDRLEALLRVTYQDVLFGLESEVLLELLIAGKHDAEFNHYLRPLLEKFLHLFERSAEHFFVSAQLEVNLHHMMLLTQWLFRGMALDKRVIRSATDFQPYFQSWLALMRQHVSAKPDVHQPPLRVTDA
jgi:AcrR family transcriptional regulator